MKNITKTEILVVSAIPGDGHTCIVTVTAPAHAGPNYTHRTHGATEDEAKQEAAIYINCLPRGFSGRVTETRKGF